MKKKILNILLLLCCFVNSYSQKDVTITFQTLLILNSTITLEDQFESKESYLKILLENVDIEIEELKTKQFIPIYFSYYKVFRFDIVKNETIIKNNLPVVFKFGLCTEYVIVYNEDTKQYYRIKGFKSNDFGSLLNDIFKDGEEKLKVKEIIKELDLLSYDGLNFDCIYKALKDSPNNLKNYPCINSCMDPKSAHLSR